MFTSYFKKCECKSNKMLKKLQDNYDKVGYDKQYEAEDLVIARLESDVLLRPEFQGIENFVLDAELNFSEEEQKTILTLKFDGRTYIVKVTPTTYRKTPIAKIDIKKG